MEEVAEASDGPLWFQLYVMKDREVTRALVERAKRAGYKALCLTVDLPVLGQRVSVRTAEIGVHVLSAGDASHLFAVSAQNRDESDLSASVTGQWGEWIDDDVS